MKESNICNNNAILYNLAALIFKKKMSKNFFLHYSNKAKSVKYFAKYTAYQHNFYFDIIPS